MVKPGKNEAQKQEQNKPKSNFWSTFPLVLLAAVFGLMIAFQTGLLDINEFKEFLGLSDGEKLPGTCPITSKDTGNECWSVDKSSGVRVSGVITFEWCNCPTDTDFVQWDNITAGGPYKICTCKTP